MKKQILLILILAFINFGAVAQNKITAYEYWYDSDSTITSVSAASPASPYTLNSSFNVSSLATGLHTFNVRFVDDSAKYSPVLSQFFFKKPVISSGSNAKIINYQIWYDGDFENATSQSVSPTLSYDLISGLNVSNLATGLHTISLRFQDDLGVWSVPVSQFFFKKPVIQSGSNAKMINYQIWYDGDFENATTQSISPSVSFDLVSSLNVSNLTTGLHTISLRFQDDVGAWSVPVSQFFFKKPETGMTATKSLTTYEYWFDEDYANASLQTVSSTQHLDLMKNIDVSALNTGLHTITIRFRDDGGYWSVPLAQFFFKKPETAVVANKMVEYRYWFNEDDDKMTYAEITPSVSQFELMNTFDMTHLWKGDYSIHFQFKDKKGKWSVVTTDSITKASLPIAKFTHSAVSYCDSVVVTFQNQSVDADSVFWDFGDGTTSNEWEPTHVFMYQTKDVSLYVKDTTSGLDSFTTQSIKLFFLQETQASLDTTVCDSYTSPSGNHVWTTSKTYLDTLTNSIGCDSILTVNLTVNVTKSENITAASCFEYVSPSLKYTWTESGTYKDTLTSSTFCDSILTINLTINTVDTGVTRFDNTLTATATNATYQWVDCNNGNTPINGETNKSFNPAKNGLYAVLVTQDNCSLLSSCYQISNVGVSKNTLSSNILVYPNPTRGLVTIDLNKICSNLHVEVRDFAGRLVSQFSEYSTEQITLEIEGSVGFYSITLLSDEGTAAIKVLKN
ncbi:MAG: T9SS type A sorting domain-containing protein [Bacteroidia bacterium]|nr:T9SS type A sorting domain-containing protein [Bacteroidia bacterium]